MFECEPREFFNLRGEVLYGSHKGKDIFKVPVGYLRRLVNNVELRSDDMRTINAILARQ